MQAKSDTIDALEAYRERSEPTFLMYSVRIFLPKVCSYKYCHTYIQGNVLVSVIRGALGPQLERTIREQLEYEHSVLDGKMERNAVCATNIPIILHAEIFSVAPVDMK